MTNPARRFRERPRHRFRATKSQPSGGHGPPRRPYSALWREHLCLAGSAARDSWGRAAAGEESSRVGCRSSKGSGHFSEDPVFLLEIWPAEGDLSRPTRRAWRVIIEDQGHFQPDRGGGDSARRRGTAASPARKPFQGGSRGWATKPNRGRDCIAGRNAHFSGMAGREGAPLFNLQADRRQAFRQGERGQQLAVEVFPRAAFSRQVGAGQNQGGAWGPRGLCPFFCSGGSPPSGTIRQLQAPWGGWAGGKFSFSVKRHHPPSSSTRNR